MACREITSRTRSLLGRFSGRGHARLLLLVFLAMSGVEPSLAASDDVGPARWSVAQGIDPYTGKDTCLLLSRPVDMPDGYGTARVQLIFGPQALLVSTDSNLDPAYPDQGIRVDGGPLIPPEPPFPFQRQGALFEIARDEIVDEFRRGREAELALGFWPTWPMTRTQRVAISLLGFSNAHDALPGCETSPARAAAH